MEYLIGIVLAAAVSAFAALSGFDRDRAFYPTALIVIGALYILFAVIGGSTQALITESLVACGFFVLAVMGFRKSLWFTAAGLVGHGVFDFFHPAVIQNPGVPAWWPGFCGSYDVVAGGLLAFIVMRRSGFSSPI